MSKREMLLRKRIFAPFSENKIKFVSAEKVVRALTRTMSVNFLDLLHCIYYIVAHNTS